MLTGCRAFDGETRSDVIAAVIERAPDWDALPPTTPVVIRRLMRRCLEKEPRDRLRHIADARLEVREAIASPETSPAPSRVRRRWVAAAAFAAVFLIGLVSWSLLRSAPNVSSPVTRFSIPVRLAASYGGRLVAISPNGSRLVYPSDRGITVRSRDRLGGDDVSVPVDFARAPFFSPDGDWVGYTDGEALYKIPVTGGTPIFIAEVGEAALASWSTDGIVVADVGGLSRVSANGGAPERLPMPPLDPGEQAAYPELLPGGHAILFTVLPTRSSTVGSSAVMPGTRVEVLNLDSGTRKILVRGGGRGHYVSTGYLVYASLTSLYAVSFSLKRLEMRGDPIQVASDVSGGEFAVSDEGTLAYLSGGGERLSTLVWTDREGHEDPLDAPPRQYVYPRLSPDGTQIALDISSPPDRDIWIWDIGRRALERFTVDPAANPIGVWSPDGTRIAFGSDRFGPTQLYLQRADRAMSQLVSSRAIASRCRYLLLQMADCCSPRRSRIIGATSMCCRSTGAVVSNRWCTARDRTATQKYRRMDDGSPMTPTNRDSSKSTSGRIPTPTAHGGKCRWAAANSPCGPEMVESCSTETLPAPCSRCL